MKICILKWDRVLYIMFQPKIGPDGEVYVVEGSSVFINIETFEVTETSTLISAMLSAKSISGDIKNLTQVEDYIVVNNPKKLNDVDLSHCYSEYLKLNVV